MGAYRLYRYLKKGNYDIIHLNYFTPLLRVAVLLAAKEKPVLITRHVTLKYEGPYWYYHLASQWLIRKRDYFTAVSQHVRDEMLYNRFGSPEK